MSNDEEVARHMAARRQLARHIIFLLVQLLVVGGPGVAGIWYAVSGTVTWLRWLAGIIGGSFALASVPILPALLVGGYGCLVLLAETPWTVWVASVVISVTVTTALDTAWWVTFLAPLPVTIVLVLLWAAFSARPHAPLDPLEDSPLDRADAGMADTGRISLLDGVALPQVTKQPPKKSPSPDGPIFPNLMAELAEEPAPQIGAPPKSNDLHSGDK